MGHSNRDFADFLSILLDFKICHLVDVRRYPTSSRFPHFNRTVIEQAFSSRKEVINYSFLGEELGGKRDIEYSHYMNSKQFLAGMNKLTEIAQNENTCFMCAEKNYQNCHRKFIAERFIQAGWQVYHIVEKCQAISHQLSLL